MDEYDWYDDDDERYLREPVVIVERSEAGVGTFLIGLALGAGVALLMAPQSGEETRRGLARRARRAQDAAKDFVEDVSGTVADKFQEVRATVEERILALQDSKRALMEAALGDAASAASLTRDDLLALLA